MSENQPHFLLFSSSVTNGSEGPSWQFVLVSLEDGERLSASDVESGSHRGRLELLAIVRGLEALDQPSRVTLVTPSRYVVRGLSHGLGEWREQGWRWERFGNLVPVRDHDLWRRLDHAMQIHDVECCRWEFDRATDAGGDGEAIMESVGDLEYVAEGPTGRPEPSRQRAAVVARDREQNRLGQTRRARRLPSVLRQVMGAVGQSFATTSAQIAS